MNGNVVSEEGKNIVGVAVLANLFGVTERTVQNYSDEEKELHPMPKLGRGQYDFVACTQWFINKLKRDIQKLEQGDETLYKLQQDGQLLTNKDKAVKLLKSLNQLVLIDDVKEKWLSEIIIFKKSLNALKYKLAIELEGINDKDERFRIISTDVDDISNQLAELDLEKEDIDEDDFLDDDEIQEKDNFEHKE